MPRWKEGGSRYSVCVRLGWHVGTEASYCQQLELNPAFWSIQQDCVWKVCRRNELCLGNLSLWDRRLSGQPPITGSLPCFRIVSAHHVHEVTGSDGEGNLAKGFGYPRRPQDWWASSDFGLPRSTHHLVPRPLRALRKRPSGRVPKGPERISR